MSKFLRDSSSVQALRARGERLQPHRRARPVTRDAARVARPFGEEDRLDARLEELEVECRRGGTGRGRRLRRGAGRKRRCRRHQEDRGQ